jgi:hypothetical protein
VSGQAGIQPFAAEISLGEWREPLRTWLLARQSDELEGLGASPSFLVGGVIRDTLLGQEPKDIDIAIGTANPLGTAQELARLVNGTAVLMDPEHQIIRITAPHLQPPHLLQSLRRGSILADLASVTSPATQWRYLNAALRPTGPLHLVDPFGGQRDLHSRALR